MRWILGCALDIWQVFKFNYRGPCCSQIRTVDPYRVLMAIRL